jgi:hypothetical protein
MSVITYVAQREIEPTGYSKTGTDISVDATDDSFNVVGSPSGTNLTGLLNNEWAKISGFLVNAVNNGWFQASANSTSSKIAQDTTTSLLTEADGASIVIVGYKRGLGNSYQLEFYSETSDRSVKSERTVNQPMDNVAAEVVLYRQEVFIDLTVLGPDGALITEALMRQYREFLASVSAGELFIFDRYGTIASPVEPKNAQLSSDDYKEERIAGTGASGLYKLSFKVRLLP